MQKLQATIVFFFLVKCMPTTIKTRPVYELYHFVKCAARPWLVARYNYTLPLPFSSIYICFTKLKLSKHKDRFVYNIYIYIYKLRVRGPIILAECRVPTLLVWCLAFVLTLLFDPSKSGFGFNPFDHPFPRSSPIL